MQLLTAIELVPPSNNLGRISKFTCDYRLRQLSIRESYTRAEYWGKVSYYCVLTKGIKYDKIWRKSSGASPQHKSGGRFFRYDQTFVLFSGKSNNCQARNHTKFSHKSTFRIRSVYLGQSLNSQKLTLRRRIITGDRSL